MTKKEEFNAQRRQSNAQRLLSDVRRGFRRGQNQHLVYSVDPSEVELAALENSSHPVSLVSDGRVYPIVCFKRDQNTPDYVYSGDPPPVWRP